MEYQTVHLTIHSIAETMESDEHCMSFVQRCLPEAIRKLMTSNAVHRWGVEIHEGIYNMLQLVVDLVAARLKYKPIPIELLELLALVRISKLNSLIFLQHIHVLPLTLITVFT